MSDGKEQGERGFDLEGAEGTAFEAALRAAEEALQSPVEPLIPEAEEEPDEAWRQEAPMPDALPEGEPESLSLQLTLVEGASLVGEISGADGLRAATPAERTEEGEEAAFEELPRSGSDAAAADDYEDWLAPMRPGEWERPHGRLTGQDGAALLGDFSGAETVPEAGAAPEEEGPDFDAEDLLSVTADDSLELLPALSAEEVFGADEEDARMSALAEVIFSADPRQQESDLPRVTARTEPEFSFKR